MTKMRNTTELEREIFQYLNELRDSGETNMLGARPYLEAHFAMDRLDARKYLTMWMNNFDPSGQYEQVKDENQ